MFALVSADVDEQVGRAPVAGGCALGHRVRRCEAEGRPEEELGGLAQLVEDLLGVLLPRDLGADEGAGVGARPGTWTMPWLATVAPLEPLPTRSLRMVMMVSSSAWVTGVWVS